MMRFRHIEPVTDAESSTQHERTSVWNELDQLYGTQGHFVCRRNPAKSMYFQLPDRLDTHDNYSSI